MALAAVAACTPTAPHKFTRGGVLALDWALAETMIALGKPPAGVVAAADWPTFVVEPKLPAGTADLGLQQELNFELMAALRPRLILISPFLAQVKPTLDRIAPSLNLSVYEPSAIPLANRMKITRELASHIDARQAAEKMIRDLEPLRKAAMQRLSRLPQRPVLLASFVDNRHARVYGGSSLYADTLAWLGLANAWKRPVGYFGFATVGIEEFATLDEVELVGIEPVPPDIARALSSSPLWTDLPFVRSGHQGRIPPVFMFGALPSARRFVGLLVDHLEERWG
ncbi:MAG: iron ABC transporter substrate-binding protein [Gammaproteobacteria bacterium PRO9]|nr:iron ABC transporter substrate-binding protein [Gammaproteobacteria bacterium PRO9]